MIHYRSLKFTHANLQRPVHVVAGTIAGYHYSEASKAVHVYTTGGVFPVSESLEQIDAIIESLNHQGDSSEQRETPVRQASNIRERKASSNGRKKHKGS